MKDLYILMNRVTTDIPESEKAKFNEDDLEKMKKMAKNISNKKNRNKTWKNTALKRIAIVTGVLLLGSGVTVGAATISGWAFQLSEYFSTTSDQEKMLDDAENVNGGINEYGEENIIAEDTCENITVQAVQSVAVRGMLFVLLKVELPENQVFSDSYVFQYDWMQTGASDDSKEANEFARDTDGRPELIDWDGNTGWYICQIDRTSYDFDGKEVTIILEGLTKTHATASELIYENPVGTWNLSCVVDCADSMIKVVEVNKTFLLDGENVLINYIEITPFYIRIYHGDKDSNRMDNMPEECGLKLKDGTVITKNWSYVVDAEVSRENGQEDGAYHLSNFKEIIDLDNVSSIILGDNTIMLE